MHRIVALALLAALLSGAAETADDTRKLLESQYVRMFDALRSAKSMEDLDAQTKEFETDDCVSVMPGQKPRTWKQLREFGFEALTSGPKDKMEFRVEKFSMPNEDTAVLEGVMQISGNKLVISAPIRDTWVRTEKGWRRKIHEKLAPNKVVSE